MTRWIGGLWTLLWVGAVFSQTMPTAASLFENADAKEALSGTSGATDHLKALRQTGSESLFEPGRRGVDAAYGKTDPTSEAVVIVDRGAASRPSVDPDPAGTLTAGLDRVKENAKELLPGLEAVSSAGSCRKVQTVVSGDTLTRTCDIRVFKEASEYAEKHCAVTLEALMRVQSRFRCTQETLRETIYELALPVIPTYTTRTTLTCLEGKRNAQIKTCRVTYAEESAVREEAHCIKPIYIATRKVCTKSLRIKPTATCVPGAVFKARAHDSGILSEDAVPGADTLEVSYTCSAGKKVALSLAVNTRNRGELDYVLETGDSVIDIVRVVGGNTLRFTGSLTCEEGACTAPVTVTVFESSGENRVFTGSLSTTLFFKPFAVTSETEYWEESCNVF